jgi:hypothetical protein
MRERALKATTFLGRCRQHILTTKTKRAIRQNLGGNRRDRERIRPGMANALSSTLSIPLISRRLKRANPSNDTAIQCPVEKLRGCGTLARR